MDAYDAYMAAADRQISNEWRKSDMATQKAERMAGDMLSGHDMESLAIAIQDAICDDGGEGAAVILRASRSNERLTRWLIRIADKYADEMAEREVYE